MAADGFEVTLPVRCITRGDSRMDDTSARETSGEEAGEAVPLLFGRRQYLESISSNASTTSCQTTRNPSDYGPDD